VVGGVTIETHFVGDPKPNHEGDGHAGGQTGDIDGGVALIAGEAAPGNSKIAFEHAIFGANKMPDC